MEDAEKIAVIEEKEFDMLPIDAVEGFVKFAPVLNSLNQRVPTRVMKFRPFSDHFRNTNFVLQQFVGTIPGITFATRLVVRKMTKEQCPAKRKSGKSGAYFQVEPFKVAF